MRSYAAVILAAGYSSRMKAFKPLLDVGGTPAISRLIRAVADSGINEIIVVTGHKRELVVSAIEKANLSDGKGKLTVIEAFNEDFHKGMFSSIKKGLSSAKAHFPAASGVMLIPVDCPLISSQVIKNLMQSAQLPFAGENAEKRDVDNERECFLVPEFEGKKGHPLLVPDAYIDEICSYDGTGGLKAITDKYWNKMIRVPVTEEGCVLDMDTPDGYDEIKTFVESGCRRVPLKELASGRRIFLIRHGETRQHAEKMFIGRYDVPLEKGADDNVRIMARSIAEMLSLNAGEDNACKPIRRIYVSPLTRTVQTAEMLRDVLHDYGLGCGRNAEPCELCIIDDLQEISLGDWDGMPVREVKERYPEEYHRRGEDMFAFKTGNKAENFYDVQYRAVKALRKILEEDDSSEVIIVSHSAVIRALENNLKGLRVDDPWENISKCEYRIIKI